MNIFASSSCPVESATVLDDRRLNKMITESIQMMATALWKHNAPVAAIPLNLGGDLYAETHKKHPCSIWVAETAANFIWLMNHAGSMCAEYRARHGKHQAGLKNLERMWNENASQYLPAGELTPFANCTPYKDMDVHAAYKKYLMDKWTNHNPKYPPSWANHKVFPGWGFCYSRIDECIIIRR